LNFQKSSEEVGPKRGNTFQSKVSSFDGIDSSLKIKKMDSEKKHSLNNSYDNLLG
jgi:hypothetical protein